MSNDHADPIEPFPRAADALLTDWHARPGRKPLVVRGARQTGKTTAVRRLGVEASAYFELNLERARDLDLIRTCRSADELLERLQQQHNLADLPRDSVLFLDEVQEHAEAIGWLRFFHEDHPEVAVVVAGSLLEVRLREEPLSFPVGRVEFLRIEPLTFLEFLRATSDDRLASDLTEAGAAWLTDSPAGGIDDGLHQLAMQRFRDFLLVGGLPEAVDAWRRARSLVEVGRVHDALHQAYAEDLLKYGERAEMHYLETVLANAPAFFGARFKLRGLGPGEKDVQLGRALQLLERAMIVHRAVPTAAHELPLVARGRAAHKLLPLDIGLALSQLGVRIEQLEGRAVESLLDGRIAEAFVGVQLIAAHPERQRSLSFWTREGNARSNAEVDFLVPTAAGVLPVEVKSGAVGSLKSLHRFLILAKSSVGIRLCAAHGGTEDLRVAVPDGSPLHYRLHSIPIYLAELIPGMAI